MEIQSFCGKKFDELFYQNRASPTSLHLLRCCNLILVDPIQQLAFVVAGQWNPSFWSPLLEGFYASMWTNISRIFKSSLWYHVICRNPIKIPYLPSGFFSLRSSPHPHLWKRKQTSLVGWSPSLNIWGIMIFLCWSFCFLWCGDVFLLAPFFPGHHLPARHWIELLLGSDASAKDSVAWYLHHKTFTRKKWSEWSKITWNLAGMLRKLVQEFHNLSRSFT